MGATTPRTINSLQRALNILGLFDEQAVNLGITEIAEALGLHKSTAAGLVYTLEYNGYLAQDPETRKYRLGFKLVERASTLLEQIDVRNMALPYLQELRAWYDESVNLAVREGGEIVYVERLTSTRTLGMHAKVGYRAPLHCTALGKAILSYTALDDVQAFITQQGLPAVTASTITDPAQFFHELARVRAQGFAVDDEENEAGVCCVAAPILDYAHQPVSAVSISVPALRFPRSDVPRYAGRLVEAARAISDRLGYNLQHPTQVRSEPG